MIRKKKPQENIVIDLTGPQGNAFYLIGFAQKNLVTLGYSKEEIANIINDMFSGDYENVVEIFDKHFGDIVILER